MYFFFLVDKYQNIMGNHYSKGNHQIELSTSYLSTIYPSEVKFALGDTVGQMDFDTLNSKYIVEEPIANGVHWIAVLGRRKRDNLKVRLK
jgi:hypothetical protein